MAGFQFQKKKKTFHNIFAIAATNIYLINTRKTFRINHDSLISNLVNIFSTKQ